MPDLLFDVQQVLNTEELMARATDAGLRKLYSALDRKTDNPPAQGSASNCPSDGDDEPPKAA